MKYIIKLSHPQSFIDWYNANNAHLQSTCSTGEEIWSRLDSRVKNELVKSLLKEQGHICAYCGTKIGKEESLTFCVEHFARKGEPSNKHLTLEYSNLLGCCKMSQQMGKIQSIPFPILNMPHLKTLKTIADYLAITVENLKQNNRVLNKVNENDDLDIINSQKPIGYKIIELEYEANIHHCDDTKSDSQKPIVNPTIEPNCENYFRYKKALNTKNEPMCEIENKINGDARIDDTIDALNLNATNLCSDRLTAYEAGEKFVTELLENGLINSYKEINDCIEKIIYAKTDDKLDPFCFVTASVVWNSFIS